MNEMRLTQPLKIVLVQVSSPDHYSLWNALSIETLAGHIRGVFSGDIAVKLLRVQPHCNLNAVVADAIAETPSILGISPELGSLAPTKQFCGTFLSRMANKTLIIFGGKIATHFPEYFLNNYPDSVVVIGEGEESLEGIIATFLNGKELVSVPNLAYMQDTQVVRTEQRNPVMHRLMYPPSIDTVDQTLASGGNVLIQASRGCSWSNCGYCTIATFRKGKRWEGFPPERVLKNIEMLVKQGATELEFADDEFLGGTTEAHLARAYEIADGLEKIRQLTNVDITFRIFLIPSTVYSELNPQANSAVRKLLLRLRDVGLTRIYIGAESGCTSQLRRYGRGYSKEDLKKAIVILIHELRIPIDVGFVMFDPDLSVKELQENILFFRELNLIKSNQWPFRPLVVNVGSKIAQKLDKKLLGDPNVNYMSYDCLFTDKNIQSIYDVVDALSTETRSIFYALKVVAKRQFCETKRDLPTVRAQHYIEQNAGVYLDLMEELAHRVEYSSGENETSILTRARRRTNELVGLIGQDISHGVIPDPSGFIEKQIDNFLDSQEDE